MCVCVWNDLLASNIEIFAHDIMTQMHLAIDDRMIGILTIAQSKLFRIDSIVEQVYHFQCIIVSSYLLWQSIKRQQTRLQKHLKM